MLDIANTYTRKQAARKLGMGIATFDRLRYAGKIEEVRYSPHKIRFTDEALTRYLVGQTGRVEPHSSCQEKCE